MCRWPKKDHFRNQHVAKVPRAPHITAGHLPLRTRAVTTAVSTTSLCTDAEPCSYSRCHNKAPHSDPSFPFKLIKHPGLPLLCNSFSWQREISKCLPKPDVVYLNLLILATFASGLKFTSYSHPAVNLLSCIPFLALPLLSKYNNDFFLSVWGFCVLLAASSTNCRREGRQSQTCKSITLL